MKITEITEANQLMYRGYPCTKDCGGHKAGYAWAERKGIKGRIDRIGECPGEGTHNSFWEGCKSCAEDRPQ